MTPSFPIGIVLPQLHAYRDLVHAISGLERVESTEFSYRYPLFKGTEAIKEGLAHTRSALEKFDLYFRSGVIDAGARLSLSRKFRERYLRMHPRSEGSDVFQESGKVLEFSFTLKNPPKSAAVLAGLHSYPIDESIADIVHHQGNVPLQSRVARLVLFYENVHNPVRRKDRAIGLALDGMNAENAIILELETDGALPGLFAHYLKTPLENLAGQFVLMESEEVR